MTFDYSSYYISQAKKNSNQFGFGIPVVKKNNLILDNLNNIFNNRDNQKIVPSINTSNQRKRRSVKSISAKSGGQRKKPKKILNKQVKKNKPFSKSKKVKKCRSKKINNSKSYSSDIFS